ncbi:MAG TPA: hypothetical protein VFX16_33840 [Pseudonocardiaceae bacterium]|nr:hypothetical protein [Pseudonocardiaceae bacterium]
MRCSGGAGTDNVRSRPPAISYRGVDRLLVERPVRVQPFQQQRVVGGVVRQQPHGARTRPGGQRDGLVHGFGVRPGQFEHGGRAIRAPDRPDDADIAVQRRTVGAQGPAVSVTQGQVGQLCEPVGSLGESGTLELRDEAVRHREHHRRDPTGRVKEDSSE